MMNKSSYLTVISRYKCDTWISSRAFRGILSHFSYFWGFVLSGLNFIFFYRWFYIVEILCRLDSPFIQKYVLTLFFRFV